MAASEWLPREETETRMRVMRALGAVVLAMVVLVGVVGYLFALYPLRGGHPAERVGRGVVAVEHALVYVSPDRPPLRDATVVARDGRIAAVGAGVAVPAGATVLPCDGCVVTAGFWNAHVHLTEPKWLWSEWKGDAVLNRQIADMFTSRGFTTVVDVGSDLRVTVPLRRRIETGGLLGPKIYTAGGALYPPGGIPFYLKDTLPKYLLRLLPQPATPEEAVRDEERNIRDGADVLKLFTGSLDTPHTVLPMPVPIARAAVDVAHRHGQMAFAHPSDIQGVRVAMESGVDVLAHSPSMPAGVDEAVLGEMVRRGMSMVPTLKMFGTTVTTDPSFLDPIFAEVRTFHRMGGRLMFGTDVGYMTDYTTGDEFRYLTASGLDAMDMLRMLTTAPAERFGVQGEKGTLEVGKVADFVVLDGDPAVDTLAFSRVRATVRGGVVVFP